MTLQTKQISISVNCPMEKVYKFASNPANLPKWAEGLSSSSIEKSGDEWIANSPMGRVKIKFVEENRFGVMDHFVTVESGETFYNPMRVVENREGSELTFTLFRIPNISDAEFARDAKMIEADFRRLKTILEK